MRCQIKLGFILHMTRQKQNRNNSLLIIFLFFVLFSLILFVHHFFLVFFTAISIFSFFIIGEKNWTENKLNLYVLLFIIFRGWGSVEAVFCSTYEWVGWVFFDTIVMRGVLFDTLLVRGGAEFVNTILHWIYSRMFWCCKLSSKLFLRTSVVINALFFVFLQKRWTIKRIHGWNFWERWKKWKKQIVICLVFSGII